MSTTTKQTRKRHAIKPEQAAQASAPLRVVPSPVVPEQVPQRAKKRRLFSYSYYDVAAACGISVDRVRHAASRVDGREPLLDMNNLRSVAQFIAKRQKQVTQAAA